MLVCTHTLQRLKRCFRTAETHKRYDYNSSHVLSQSFATEQWQSAVNQVQSSQRWVEPNQRSIPNQCSNIRSFSGPSLSVHANFDQPRHPKCVGKAGFFFKCARIVIISQIWLLLETVGVKKIVYFFLSIWLFWRQLAHAIRLVSSLFKYLAEKCY